MRAARAAVHCRLVIAVRSEMDRYLEALPHGLDSHPHCQIKGVIARMITERLPKGRAIEELPEPLRRMVQYPPLPTEWVPEVHASALILYSVQAVYGSIDAFVRRAYEDNVALLDSVAYKILFRFVGPRRLIAQAPSRWALFHRGTELTVLDARAPKSVIMLLRTPPKHVPAVMARTHASSYRAALETAGAKNVRVDFEFKDSATIEYRGQWE